MYRLDAIKRKIIREGLDLNRWLAVNSFRRKSIVFTNGVFDILHRGHIEYLAKAAALGDLLVIGLNTDESVKRIKGPSRPFVDQFSRAFNLASITFVSAVIFFEEDTPYNLIKTIQPNFLVKGGDYKPEDIVGYDIVSAKGGQVVTMPLVEGYSSTRIINKITGA